MPRFKVTVGRAVREYLDVEVEAENEQEAERLAINHAVLYSADPEWADGDCDYYETGIERLALAEQEG